MTTQVKHAKVSAVADDTDATKVRPSDWNDDHDVAIDAADVAIADAGTYFTSTDVEGALQEVGAAIGSGSGAPDSASYIVAAASAGLSAEIVIPGLAGSADIPAGGGSDDEFGTTDTSDPMTGWTTLGSPTAHDINSTKLSHYYVRKSAAAGTGDCGIRKAWSPAAGATVTCKLSGAELHGQYNKAFLFIGEATPGKLIAIMLDYVSATAQVDGWGIAVDYHTNPTTFNSHLVGGTGSNGMYPPIYFRIRYNSSTSIDYGFSFDGVTWTYIVTGHNPGFTVGCAGLGIGSESASFGVSASFDWIRFA